MVLTPNFSPRSWGVRSEAEGGTLAESYFQGVFLAEESRTMLNSFIAPDGSRPVDEWPVNKARQPAFRSPPEVLVYRQHSPVAEQVQAYARYLAGLLNGRLGDCSKQNVTAVTGAEAGAGTGQELIIFAAPDQSPINRLFLGPADARAVMQFPTSLLIARRPRWPLRRILFVTRGHEMDGVAVQWVVALARASRAAITVLVIQPPLSAVDSQALCRADWLASDTPLGRQLRPLARGLGNWQTSGRLHFRPGLPGYQVKAEVTEGDPDLIVIATDPENWWLRRLVGEMVKPLLDWIDRPVLVAKPPPQ
jgi:nucleotide-binding universal stress UspA family protein